MKKLAILFVVIFAMALISVPTVCFAEETETAIEEANTEVVAVEQPTVKSRIKEWWASVENREWVIGGVSISVSGIVVFIIALLKKKETRKLFELLAEVKAVKSAQKALEDKQAETEKAVRKRNRDDKIDNALAVIEKAKETELVEDVKAVAADVEEISRPLM